MRIKDIRLKKTLNESIEVLKEKGNLLIFPEDSDDGYYIDIVCSGTLPSQPEWKH